MTFTITEPGIYFDVPSADYFADPTPTPSLTQSIAKILIDKSPAHAAVAHPRLSAVGLDDDTPEKYDAAKAIGDAAHALLIGRGKDIAVADFPNWLTKVAKEFRADAIEAGKSPILAKHFSRAAAMVVNVHKACEDVGWGEAFCGGHGEVVIAWREGDIWFRSLLDWMPKHSTNYYDFKTTGLSVAPHAIPKLMVDAGWAVQAAFHEKGLDVLDPDNAGRRKFRFIAQENEPPYAVTPVELTEYAMTMGRKQVQYAVDVWKRCLAEDRWPSYPGDVCYPDYPQWHEVRWLEREIKESEARAQKPKMIESLMGG